MNECGVPVQQLRQKIAVIVRDRLHAQIARVTATNSGIDDSIGIHRNVFVEAEQFSAVDVMQVRVSGCHQGLVPSPQSSALVCLCTVGDRVDPGGACLGALMGRWLLMVRCGCVVS